MNEEQFRQLMKILKDIKEAILLSVPIEEEPLDLIRDIQSAFFKQLRTKTGRERNEVKNTFKTALKSVLE